MKWENTFAEDFVYLSEKQLFEKYYRKIPSGTYISDIVNAVKALSFEEKIVQETWTAIYSDRMFNLLKTEDGYEVFDIDRGGRHSVEKHSSIDSALFDKIDRIFNAMLYTAPDASQS